MLFHCNNGRTNAPQYHFVRTLLSCLNSVEQVQAVCSTLCAMCVGVCGCSTVAYSPTAFCDKIGKVRIATGDSLPIRHTIWLEIPCQYSIQFDLRFPANTAYTSTGDFQYSVKFDWRFPANTAYTSTGDSLPIQHTIRLEIPCQYSVHFNWRFPANTVYNSTGDSLPIQRTIRLEIRIIFYASCS
jgi:hypothetical protein